MKAPYFYDILGSDIQWSNWGRIAGGVKPVTVRRRWSGTGKRTTTVSSCR